MSHQVTLIPGDGIGPEVTAATVRILEASGVKITWEKFSAGAEAYEKYQEYIPKELIESVQRTGVALKGPVTTPSAVGFPASTWLCASNSSYMPIFALFATCHPWPRGTPPWIW